MCLTYRSHVTYRHILRRVAHTRRHKDTRTRHFSFRTCTPPGDRGTRRTRRSCARGSTSLLACLGVGKERSDIYIWVYIYMQMYTFYLNHESAFIKFYILHTRRSDSSSILILIEIDNKYFLTTKQNNYETKKQEIISVSSSYPKKPLNALYKCLL